MTGPVPDAPQVVVGWLRIDCGQYTRPWAPGTGRWIKHPSADYWCACGFTDSASGEAAVRAFVATIRAVHAADCPRGEAP